MKRKREKQESIPKLRTKKANHYRAWDRKKRGVSCEV